MNQFNLDGIDIDWEYPDPNTQSANDYVSLMTELGNAMHSRGKLLTAAVVAQGGTGGGVLNAVFNVVDFLNIMAYDANDYQHSTYDYAVSSLNYWRNRGLPKEKAVLGVPFYSRPGWYPFWQLLQMGASANADTWNGQGYNGLPTIRNKTNLAFDNGSGIMIWELSNDAGGANSLLSAIYEVKQQRGGGNPPQPSVAPIGKTIWLQGFNGQYVSSENGEEPMNCNRPTIQGWEQFLVVDAGGGKIALQNNGMYVSSENGLQPINCKRPTIQGWEAFDFIVNSDGTKSLRGNNGMYVSSENGTQAMNCNRPTIQGWEAFRWGVVGAARTAAKLAPAVETEAVKAGAATVYPNPVVRGAAATVKVEKFDASQPVQVVITDVNQRVVATQKANAGTVTVPTGNIPSGMYIMSIKNGANTYTKKIIIQ